MRRSLDGDPNVDPWTIGRGPGSAQHWLGRDLRSWSAGQRYTAALVVAFALIVITTSRGPTSSADDFLDGIGEGSVEELSESPTAADSTATSPEATFDAAVAPAPAATEPAAAGPVAMPPPEPVFEPEAPSPPPPAASPSPSPSSPPPDEPDEPDEQPTDLLPLPLPIR